MVNDLLLKISTFNDLKREEKAGFCSKLLKDIDKLQIKMNLCQELSVFKSYQSWYHAAEMLFDINVQCEKPLSNGINFLGYVQHIFYRLVRRRVVNNFRRKLRSLNPLRSQSDHLSLSERQVLARPSGELAAKPTERVGTEGNRLFALLTKIRSVLTSYLAYSSKANSFRIVVKTLHPHQWLKQFFRLYRTKAAFIEEITLENKGFITNFF